MIVRPVTGIVLAGGRSRRMGIDKATVLFGDRTMLRRCVDALGEAGCSPVMVLHHDHGALESTDVAFRRDLSGGQGPLDGLVSALTIADTSVVVTLPVDLPLIDSGDVRRLLLELEGSVDLDAVALSDDSDSRQHLAAAWRRDRCLAVLQHAFDGGERSAKRAITRLSMGWARVPSDHLLNVNTPNDLRWGSGPSTSL